MKFFLSKRAGYKIYIDSTAGLIMFRLKEILQIMRTTGSNCFYSFPKSTVSIGLTGLVVAGVAIKKLYEYSISIQDVAQKLKDIVIDLDNVVSQEANITQDKQLLSKIYHWRTGLRNGTANFRNLTYLSKDPTSKEFSIGLDALMKSLAWIGWEWDIPLSKLNREKFRDLYNKISAESFLLNKKLSELEITMSNAKKTRRVPLSRTLL